MELQENIKTPIIDSYDVAVCGGGFAGISAALASARLGKKTVLFEREFILGGLATAGLVTIYLPLCDGMGRQVSFGIAEELFKLSISMGEDLNSQERYPENWLDGVGSRTEKDKRFLVQFNPHLFAMLTEKLLLENGVDIMYGSAVCSVKVENEKITHLIVENKSGRGAYKVNSVVDATGDCDVGKLANAPCKTFKQGNVLASWYYYLGKNGYNLNLLGYADIPDEEKDKQKEYVNAGSRRFGGLDAKELSEQTCLSHASTLNDIINRRREDESVMPITMATIPQVRMTRKIDGEYEMSEKEEHVYFEDSIGMVSNWRKRGPVYEVPARTLYSSKVKNLACAGRCTSVTETFWDIMRVIPCCAVTGQAAGTMAGMSDDFTTLSIEKLQEQLKRDGVVLHERDL